MELIVQNLSRLDESNEEDVQGVYFSMGCIENLVEIRPDIALLICEKTQILKFLLLRLKIKKFDGNKVITLIIPSLSRIPSLTRIPSDTMSTSITHTPSLVVLQRDFIDTTASTRSEPEASVRLDRLPQPFFLLSYECILTHILSLSLTHISS